MQKQYFQLDKVHSITLTYEKQYNGWEWFPEVPSRPKKFLGIDVGVLLGVTESIPAGWSEWEDGARRKPSSYFDSYEWYRVDEVNKKLFSKPHVEIRFGYKESLGVRFETDKEAEEYVNGLVEASNIKFAVIINK
jgi:hypothetical protein